MTEAGSGGLRSVALQQLQAEYEAAKSRKHLRVLALTGDAGSGKTTLLLELRRHLLELTDAPRLGYGRALGSAGTDSARQPVREALRDLVAPAGKASRRLATLVQVLRQSAPAWLGVIPVVGPVVSAVTSTTYATVSALSAEQHQVAGQELPESVNQQFCSLVSELAQHSPVVLLLDDLHWSDVATSDLLLALTQNVTARPVLLVLAFRPYAGDESLVGHPARRLLPRMRRYLTVPEVLLQPLDDAGVADLLLASTGLAPSIELRDWVSARSGGNPLFVRELIKLLSERSLVKKRQGFLTFARSNTVLEDLPTTLSSVLDERLTAVNVDQRSFLDAAAVLGASFEFRQAYKTAGLQGDELSLRLSLGRRGAWLIVPDEVRPGRYRFAHPLFVEHLLHCLRDVDPACYRLFHSRAAVVLGERGDTDDVEWLHDMARLHREAQNFAEAHLYSALCAESAAESGALPIAVWHAEWAVEMADQLPSSSDRLQARLLLGRLQFETVRVSQSLQTLREARNLLQPTDPPSVVAQLAAAQGWALSGSRLWEECRKVLNDALAIKADLGGDLRSELLMLLGASYLFGQPLNGECSRDLLFKAQGLAESATMRATVARHLVLAHLALRDKPGALDACLLAQQASVRTTSPGLRFQTWLFEAYLRLALLDLQGARQALMELRSLSARHDIQAIDIHRLTGRTEGLAGDVQAAAAGWWRFLEYDLSRGSDEPTRRWALTHFQLGIEELQHLRGDEAALSLLTTLHGTVLREVMDGSDVAPLLGARLSAYADAVEKGENLAAGAARRGHPLSLDATAATVHALFVPDLDEARRHWSCSLS